MFYTRIFSLRITPFSFTTFGQIFSEHGLSREAHGRVNASVTIDIAVLACVPLHTFLSGVSRLSFKETPFNQLN